MHSNNSRSSETANKFEVVHINVALVGRMQSGKSTIMNTLTDSSFVLQKQGFSDTREPVCKCFTVRDVRDNQYYSLNIIDTPGLKEVRRIGEVERSDAELLNLIGSFLELNISEINVICFVSRAGETHLHDIDVFNKIMRFLGEELNQISMMVLTHCDSFETKQVDKFKHDIETHPKTKETFRYCKLGIKRFGAVSKQKLEAFLKYAQDEQMAKKVLKRVEANLMAKTEVMRNDLIEAWIQTSGFTKRIVDIKDISQRLKNGRQYLIQQALSERDNKIAAKEEMIKELQGKIRDADDARTQAQKRYEKEIAELSEKLKQFQHTTWVPTALAPSCTAATLPAHAASLASHSVSSASPAVPCHEPACSSFATPAATPAPSHHLNTHCAEAERCAANDGLRPISVQGDGACMFRAVCISDSGTDSGHLKLRADAVSYMSSHESYFKSFLLDEGDPDERLSFSSYLVTISQPHQQAGEFALNAIANVLGKQINVYHADCLPRPYSPEGHAPVVAPGAPGECVNILYLDSASCNNGHYEALVHQSLGAHALH